MPNIFYLLGKPIDLEEVEETAKFFKPFRSYIFIKLKSGQTIKIKGFFPLLYLEEKKIRKARLHFLSKKYAREERIKNYTVQKK